MDPVTIGLDIGASAVRAAEVETKGGKQTLRRYGQVGLAPGAVADGEIVNVHAVTDALKRLWEETGFSTNRVVVGVSGPRVFVRQADVPALSPEDLRSSLKFEGQELIPIPMDDASFDFSIIEENAESGSDGKPTSRILLVAAHRNLLEGYLAVLKSAGLVPVAMDASALALTRVVSAMADPETSAPTGIEVLVSLGAELTTVAVRENGIPRFIRSLALGGSKLTETVANSMHLELAVAERLKRGQVDDAVSLLGQSRKAMSVEIRDLAEEVRATVDFFLAQSGSTAVERLLVTGGASLTEGLTEAVARDLAVPVERIDPFGVLTRDDLGLDPAQMRHASSTAATAIGLAMWSGGSPLIRLSLMPDEVLAARRARKLAGLAGIGLGALAAMLVVAGFGQVMEVHSARQQVARADAQVQTLTSQVNSLTARTAVHGEVQSRADLVATSLQGDIDWVRVLGQLAATMPPNLSLTTFTGSSAVITSGTGSTGSAQDTQGTLSFSVQGTGGLPAVSSWLNGLARDPDLQGTYVSGISVTGNNGQVTFSSDSALTKTAESTRATEAKNEFHN